jgi:hypothetical protein
LHFLNEVKDMKAQQAQAQSYQNIMEVLVTEEVKRQLRNYPPTLVKYLNKIEVETYALNRLPPLYASCAEGWHQQKKRADLEFRDRVTQAVRQGFAAVQRDPIRLSTPIGTTETREHQRLKKSLSILQGFLRPNESAWQSLARVAKQISFHAHLSSRSVTDLASQPTDYWTEYHQIYRY